MYSQKQKSSALEVYHQTNSVSETIRILGYPTRRQLYTWTAAENMVKRERKPLPRFANPPDHSRQDVWELFKKGQYEIYISDVVVNEINKCSIEKQEILLDYLDQIEYN